MPAAAAADPGTGRRPAPLDEGEGLRGPGGRRQPQLGEKLGAHDETQARGIRVGGLEQPVTYILLRLEELVTGLAIMWIAPICYE